MTAPMPTHQATFVSMAKPENNNVIKFINITARDHNIFIDIERKVWEDSKHTTPPYTAPYGGDFVRQKERVMFAQEQIKKIQTAFSLHSVIKDKAYYINCETSDGQITEIPVPKEMMNVIGMFKPKQPKEMSFGIPTIHAVPT